MGNRSGINLSSKYPNRIFEFWSKYFVDLIPIKEIKKGEDAYDKPLLSIYIFRENNNLNLYLVLYLWSSCWFYRVTKNKVLSGHFSSKEENEFLTEKVYDIVAKEALDFFQGWTEEGKTEEEKKNMIEAYDLFQNCF